MIEWALLVVLVPLVLVPVVLLLGFAGCDSFEAAPAPVPPDYAAPSDLTATPKGENEIELAWKHSDLGAVSFVVASLGPTGWSDPLTQTTARTLLDAGLVKGTSYYYRVRAIAADGRESPWSSLVAARTLEWVQVYGQAHTNDDNPYAGRCLVQRFAQSMLEPPAGTVTQIRLTLAGDSAGRPLELGLITLSHAAAPAIPPPSGPEPFDSDGMPVPVAGPYTVPGNGQEVTLPATAFALDPTRDLLVAFDVLPTSQSRIRFVDQVSGATCYISPAGVAAAAADDRTGNWTTQQGRVYLVRRIELLVG